MYAARRLAALAGPSDLTPLSGVSRPLPEVLDPIVQQLGEMSARVARRTQAGGSDRELGSRSEFIETSYAGQPTAAPLSSQKFPDQVTPPPPLQ
jgi:hypothetical protein